MSCDVHYLARALAFSILGALVAVPASAQSEATLRGRVTEAGRGAVTGAVVLLEPVAGGATRQADVDEAGAFVFTQLPPGEYVASAVSGSLTSGRVNVVIKPRESRTLTLTLDTGRLDVDVQVSGDRPAPSTHSPSSTLLSRETLGDRAMAERGNLPDALVTAAPGLIRGHDDFVHVRGQELALNPLINGVSFWENPHVAFSTGFSPEIIESANLMTGGFNAEYGNRFGGVVDIVTKSGLQMDKQGTAIASGGQEGRWAVEGDFGGHSGRTAFYVFGSGFGSDRFISPPEPEAIHDSGAAGRGFFQLDRVLGEDSLLRATVMGDGVTFEIPVTALDTEIRPEALADQKNRQQTAIVGWTRTARHTTVSVSAYERWSTASLSPAAGPLTVQAAYGHDLFTFGAKADVTRYSGRHAFKYGVDAVYLSPREDLSYDYSGYRELAHLLGLSHIHIAGNQIDYSGRDKGGEISVYAQDDVQLGDRVTAGFGVRFDHFGVVTSSTHLSPRVNLAVALGGQTTLHASYNHFFVPPAMEGLLSSSAGLTEQLTEIGEPLPPLEPSVDNQVELGASTTTGPLGLALTGYYRWTDNPLHTTVWPDSRVYSYASFDRARAYGMEVRATTPGLARFGVHGYVNYALGRVYFWNPVTGGFVTEAEHLEESNRFLAPMDQTHTLTAGARYRHAESGLWFGMNLEYGSGTPMGHGGHEHADETADDHMDGEQAETMRVPAHTTADLSFGVDLLRSATERSALSVRLDIQNITDHAYLIAQEGEFTTAQYYIPRLVSVSLTFRF